MTSNISVAENENIHQAKDQLATLSSINLTVNIFLYNHIRHTQRLYNK